MNYKINNIFTTIIAISILSGCDFNLGEPIGTTKSIEFNELNESIKIEAKAWGLAGNHETVTISNEESTITFHVTEIYYKKVGVDSLIIHVASSSFNKKIGKWSSPVTLIFQELKNYDEVQDYCLNYKEYGLSKISVYSPDRDCVPEVLPLAN